MATLHEAHSLDPPHVSSYDLQVEEGTAFGKWYSRDDHGRPPLPRDEEAADAYRTASAFWRSQGYLHYEVSSYARSEDDISRHNSGYWKPRASWRGLGLGAASSVNGARFSRPRSMNEYEAWVADGAVVPSVTASAWRGRFGRRAPHRVEDGGRHRPDAHSRLRFRL